MRLRIIVLAGAVAAGSGCAEERRYPCPCPPEGQIDQALMLRLASARALHHQADLYLEQGEVDQALEAVRSILELDLSSRWPEAEEVRLDATARLAKLLLGQGLEDEALAAVDRELGRDHRRSFYLSNLHAVRGEVLEHRAKRLRKEGREEPARQAARRAIQAFERSIAMNKALQHELIQKGEGQ